MNLKYFLQASYALRFLLFHPKLWFRNAWFFPLLQLFQLDTSKPNFSMYASLACCFTSSHVSVDSRKEPSDMFWQTSTWLKIAPTECWNFNQSKCPEHNRPCQKSPKISGVLCRAMRKSPWNYRNFMAFCVTTLSKVTANQILRIERVRRRVSVLQ